MKSFTSDSSAKHLKKAFQVLEDVDRIMSSDEPLGQEVLLEIQELRWGQVNRQILFSYNVKTGKIEIVFPGDELKFGSISLLRVFCHEIPPMDELISLLKFQWEKIRFDCCEVIFNPNPSENLNEDDGCWPKEFFPEDDLRDFCEYILEREEELEQVFDSEGRLKKHFSYLVPEFVRLTPALWEGLSKRKK